MSMKGRWYIASVTGDYAVGTTRKGQYISTSRKLNALFLFASNTAPHTRLTCILTLPYKHIIEKNRYSIVPLCVEEEKEKYIK